MNWIYWDLQFLLHILELLNEIVFMKYAFCYPSLNHNSTRFFNFMWSTAVLYLWKIANSLPLYVQWHCHRFWVKERQVGVKWKCKHLCVQLCTMICLKYSFPRPFFSFLHLFKHNKTYKVIITLKMCTWSWTMNYKKVHTESAIMIQ